MYKLLDSKIECKIDNRIFLLFKPVNVNFLYN